MKDILNVAYGSISAQMLDIYLPEGDVSSVFVYFHGGGLESGDKKSAAIFAPYLTERGIAVISANYRMYPGYEYPDFICDAASAVAFSVEYAEKELGCKTVYVGGSSAGGYLSMMLCFDSKYLAEVGLDNSRIAGYFHDAGQPTAHFNVLKHKGVDPRRVIVDDSAPLYHIGADKEYPPMLVIVSTHDIENRYEQTMLLLSTLKDFGCGDNVQLQVMESTHCGYIRKADEQGESIFGKLIADFILK
jgi:dipeptidyl aminopeptidase/acylaminoacyl peptidase